jgi:hypothetical protein
VDQGRAFGARPRLRASLDTVLAGTHIRRWSERHGAVGLNAAFHLQRTVPQLRNLESSTDFCCEAVPTVGQRGRLIPGRAFTRALFSQVYRLRSSR